MSDLPPPPPAVPPPPPPPPNLTAPPGYAAYSGGPFGSVPLKRVGGVSKAAMILVAIAGLMPVLDLAVRQTVTDEADRYLAGGYSNDQDFVEDIAGYAAVSLIQGLAMIAALVLVIIWMFRVVKNHRTLHRGGTWGPGWAIGGWFLPPCVWVIPTLVLREMWKASDPDVPVGGDWKSRPASPLPIVWFLVYTVPSLIAFGVDSGDFSEQFNSGNEETLAEQINGSQTTDVVVAVASVIAAVLFIMIVRQITDRHRRLTGEANAR